MYNCTLMNSLMTCESKKQKLKFTQKKKVNEKFEEAKVRI